MAEKATDFAIVERSVTIWVLVTRNDLDAQIFNISFVDALPIHRFGHVKRETELFHGGFNSLTPILTSLQVDYVDLVEANFAFPLLLVLEMSSEWQWDVVGLVGSFEQMFDSEVHETFHLVIVGVECRVGKVAECFTVAYVR
jgi:hypothetical protein